MEYTTKLMNGLDKRRALEIMLESRQGDEQEMSLLRQGKGWFQIGSAGHEALACLGFHMHQSDVLVPHYRDKAILLARGVKTAEFAALFFGKRNASGRGRQMPAHFSFKDQNVWSIASPTPSHLLPASGIAWAIQCSGESSIVVACLGDGGTRQGEFYESFAFAAEKLLPIVFVVEDNHFAISTDTRRQNPRSLRLLDERRVIEVDGRDPLAVYDAAGKATESVRNGSGPIILWCDLDRLCSHTSSDDQATYRPTDDLEHEKQNDPVEKFSDRLIREQMITSQELEDLSKEIREKVATAYAAAYEAQEPTAQDVYSELIAELPLAKTVEIPLDQRERMADAVNAVFHKALETDERVIFFGEDIEDPKGGVFRLTKGLSTAFPDRVFNSPLSEGTIVGIACGVATHGLRPIFELQFIDFVGPAWNQLVNNLATLRWRSDGQWTCPAIIYAPCGAYLPGGGIWHSQTNASPMAHFPGLRIAIPSTPDDAAGLFWTAMECEDPVIILLPKHLLWKRFDVSKTIEPVGFAQSRLVRQGSDVTLVAWGNCIEVSEMASDELKGRFSVEIIDLRSVMPWDRDAVARSLEKTGRLLVVQEETESCSLGQMIISTVVNREETWDTLLCQPHLLSKPDIHIGFNPRYEDYILPTKEKVIRAVQRICSL